MHRPITYAYLETTNYCNLSCTFCNRDEVVKKLKHMSLTDWQLVLEKLKHQPIKEAKLMGLGEPFLHPKFSTICKMFKDYFPNAFLIVATNCQYNINDKFRECMKYIDVLYFSIDGYKESYERDRSPAKWKKLIRFLDQFKSVDRHDCDVVVNYVVNAYNVEDIEKIDNLRKENNLGMLRLNIAQIWDANTKMSDDIATSGYTEEQLNYLKDTWGNNIMGRSKWDFEDCFWVNNGIYTTVEGHIKMCCMNTGAKPFGNLFENSIDEIRLMEDYQNVKKGCQTNNPTSHCKNCSYKELTPILEYVGV